MREGVDEGSCVGIQDVMKADGEGHNEGGDNLDYNNDGLACRASRRGC